jgi:hypothetical protein
VKKADRERQAERVGMVRNLLESHKAMKAAGGMALTEVQWVFFKLGCSAPEAEKLVAQAKQEAKA